jgi:hypothetical protein
MRKSVQRQLQDMVLLWAVTWAAVGLALGIVQLLRTGELYWIPALGLGAAAAGLGIGVVYTGLMLVTSDWRDSLADNPALLAQLGPPVLCGAGAGLAGGLLAGGLDGALFFGAVAACWAAVFNWRSVRDSIAARAARSKLTKAKLR